MKMKMNKKKKGEKKKKKKKVGGMIRTHLRLYETAVQLAEDVQLADPPCDEVAVLGPEVQDGDLGSSSSSSRSKSNGSSHVENSRAGAAAAVYMYVPGMPGRVGARTGAARSCYDPYPLLL